jgi:DNA end-binding protein Ku
VARSFWKGTISFGLVAIPVRMSIATEKQTPNFHLLHKKCLTRPQQILYCEKDNEYFGQNETVRGYEFEKEQYLVLKESDFENVPLKTLHAIEIVGFIDSKEIDPIYIYDTHYLEPEELGVKPFFLLREALIKTNKMAVAKVTFQRREHLCSVRPFKEIMALHSVHYEDEILAPENNIPAKTKLVDEEMDMAVSLISAMTKKFTPEQYKDEYSVAIKKMIGAKLKGLEIPPTPSPPEMKIADLMSALRASVKEARKVTTAKK